MLSYCFALWVSYCVATSCFVLYHFLCCIFSHFVLDFVFAGESQHLVLRCEHIPSKCFNWCLRIWCTFASCFCFILNLWVWIGSDAFCLSLQLAHVYYEDHHEVHRWVQTLDSSQTMVFSFRCDRIVLYQKRFDRGMCFGVVVACRVSDSTDACVACFRQWLALSDLTDEREGIQVNLKRSCSKKRTNYCVQSTARCRCDFEDSYSFIVLVVWDIGSNNDPNFRLVFSVKETFFHRR